MPTTADPVRDLTALVAAYSRNAVDHPDLYRVMFDASVDLEDLGAADATLEYLVRAALRGRDAGRFRAELDPLDLATQTWAVGHGVVSLVANGPLPREALAHVVPMLSGLFIGAGDEPARCRRSVGDGWREHESLAG